MAMWALIRVLEQRCEVVQAVEKVPDIPSGALLAVTMQVDQGRVTEVALEGLAGAPLHEDQDLPRLDVTEHLLAKAAQGDHPSAVSINLRGGAPRVGEVFVTVCDVEQVELVNRTAQRRGILSPEPGRRRACSTPNT